VASLRAPPGSMKLPVAIVVAQQPHAMAIQPPSRGSTAPAMPEPRVACARWEPGRAPGARCRRGSFPARPWLHQGACRAEPPPEGRAEPPWWPTPSTAGGRAECARAEGHTAPARRAVGCDEGASALVECHAERRPCSAERARAGACPRPRLAGLLRSAATAPRLAAPLSTPSPPNGRRGGRIEGH
jgi:hypothetical protein